jgi:hypothetical protein
LVVEVVEPLSVTLLFVFLLTQTWLRWSDPLIDFPRDLYYAWRMSQGDLLYQQLANWYGPLAQLLDAAGFRLFGVGIDTIVWMNIALTVAVLLLLRAILRGIGNRLAVWLGSVAFLVVFAFGHSLATANYNFITPYVAQTTYSFLGLLLVLWGLVRHAGDGRRLWLGIAGLGFAVAYLDKPEAVLAAGGALGVYFATQALRTARSGRGDWSWLARSVGWLAGGFFVLWLPVLAYFSCRGGLAYGFHATNYVAITILDSKFRYALLGNPMMQVLGGFDKPGENFLRELRAGTTAVLLGGMLAVAAKFCGQSSRRFGRCVWAGLMLAVAGQACLLLVGHGADVGAALVLPVWGAAFWLVGRNLWSAWRRESCPPEMLGRAVVGVASGLMLARIFLHGSFGDYGFFMMPLAALFGIQVMATAVSDMRTSSRQLHWLGPVAVALVVLLDCAILGRASLDVYAHKTYEVGRDRDRLYAFPPKVQPYGWLLNTMVRTFREQTPQAPTLLALPEGIAVNYHLRVPSPLAEVEFQPLSLHYMDLPAVLDELQAHPPAAVFLFHREMSEYGIKYFGATAASGRDLLEWLNQRYGVQWRINQSGDNITGDALDLAVPKTADRTLSPLLPPGK